MRNASSVARHRASAEASHGTFAGINLVYTQYLNRKQRRSGRLWQNRFFSCPVDKDEYLWPVLRYIETNPERAGIVKRPWDYEWSSARYHILGETDPVVSGPDWLVEEMGHKKYRGYLTEGAAEAKEIRQRTASGRPLGGAGFIARIESRAGRRLVPGKAGRPRVREE